MSVVDIHKYNYGNFVAVGSCGSLYRILRGIFVPHEFYGKERWVAKLVARLAVNAALWVRNQTSLKNIQNGRHRKWSGQHTLARQKK